MAKNNNNSKQPTPDPKEVAQAEQKLLQIAEQLEAFNKRINSGFQEYLEGNREVLELEKRRLEVQKLMADVTGKTDNLSKAKLKFYLQEQQFYTDAIEQQKLALKNVNLLVLAYNKIETVFVGMAGGILKSVYDYTLDADKAWRDLNLTMGLSGDRTYLLRSNLIDASVQAAHLGVSFKELTEIQSDYTAQVGTAALLSEQNLTSIVEMGKGTKMGTAEAAKMAGKFSLIGKSIESTKNFYQDAVNQSVQFGVSASAVIEKINENLDKAQMHVFAGGVSGLKDMAMYSTKFNLDMNGVFSGLDKTNNLEGVVDAVSQLQVLGGKFARVDPFKLLYQSRNDAVGFEKTIQGLTAGMVTFNAKSGEFSQINAGDLNRLKLAAEATNVPYEALIKTAYKGAQINMIDGLLGSGLNQSQKEFIEGIAQLKDGKFKVEVSPGQFREVSTLTSQQVENLKTNNTTLAKMAEQSQTFNDVFKNTLDELKAGLLPILMPIADTLQKLSSSGWLKPILAVGSTLVLAVGAIGSIRSVIEPLSIFLPKLKDLGKFSQLMKIGGKVGSGVSAPGGTNLNPSDPKLMQQTGLAAEGAWKSILAFGGAIALVGAGVWLASEGIAAMANSFSKLDGKQILGLSFALAGLGSIFAYTITALAALAPLEVEAAIGLGIFGGAVALVGAGIGIAAVGLGFMAKGFGEMFDSLSKVTNPQVISNLSGLVFGLSALAVSSLLFANPLAWIGLKVLTSSVGDLADKLSTLDFANLSSGANNFNQIADAIEKINDKKLDKLIAVADSLGTIGSLAALFANLSNSFGDGIKVEFKDQIVPVTIDLTAAIDSQAITKIVSKTVPLAIRSSQKGGTV